MAGKKTLKHGRPRRAKRQRQSPSPAASSPAPEAPGEGSQRDSEPAPASPLPRQADLEAEARADLAETVGDDPTSSLPAPPLPEDVDDEPVGNPIRWPSIAIALAGMLVAFLMMAKNAHWAVGAPVGLGALLVATWGLLDTLGTFDDGDDAVVTTAPRGAFWPRAVELVAAMVSLVVSLRLAVAGVLPSPVVAAALLVTGSFLWLVVATYRTGEALGVGAGKTPLVRRAGFWVVAGVTVIHLPLLGSCSLIDPWETHYGEVAREMLARQDWLTLWWAQEKLFFSKPILDFWIQGISFLFCDLPFAPDRMLAGIADGYLPQPEWAARMPIFLMALTATYILYRGVARVYGRLTGLLSALVLTSMPYWYFIGRQSMTDLPYVAPLTAALGLLLIGFHADPQEQVKTYELALGSRRLRFSAYHLLFGAIVLTTLPQVLYLLSRNVTWHVVGPAAYTISVHADFFQVGSGMGNCGLPGNDPCASHWPFNRAFQPALGALVWGVCAGVLLVVKRGERRVQRLAFIGAWYAIALSALAKGAPGLVIPLFVVAAYVVATGRYRDLLRMELGALFLLFACVTLPWYVQSYMRHGMPFLNRLLFHDMYKRAFVHVHDTNAGVDVSFRYYIWQLGYGLFPWTGLSVAGFAWWLRRDDPRGDARAQANILLGIWFIASFSLFTLSLTKFHHYVFPAVPPLAVLTAVVLASAIDPSRLPRGRPLVGYVALSLAAVVLVVWGLTTVFGGHLLGVPGAPPSGWGFLAILGGALVGAAAVILARRWRGAAPHDEAQPDPVMLAGLVLLGTVVTLLAGRDLLTSLPGDVEGQARLFHLFIYNYDRPWPASQQFGAALGAFVLLAVLLGLALAFQRWRTHAAVLVACLGIAWSAWGVNAYFTLGARHWGQRETIAEYYRQRAGPEEPLVAYQLNWKGENFYTGNRLPAFVSDPKGFKEWVAEQRTRHTKVVFFTTEHKRMEGLERALGKVQKFEVVTSQELCNQFALARVVF